MTRSPFRERNARYWNLTVALTIVLFALRYLCGCYTLPTAARPYDTRPYPHRAQLQAWVAWGLPIGKCADAELHVQRLPSIEAVTRVCGAPYRVRACVRRYSVGAFGASTAYVLHVLADNPKYPEPNLRAHETAHVFQLCGLGVRDPKHSDKRVWPHLDEQRQWVRAAEDAIREAQP